MHRLYLKRSLKPRFTSVPIRIRGLARISLATGFRHAWAALVPRARTVRKRPQRRADCRPRRRADCRPRRRADCRRWYAAGATVPALKRRRAWEGLIARLRHARAALVPGAHHAGDGARHVRSLGPQPTARAAGREAVAAGGHVPIIAHAPHGGLDVALALGQSPALASTPVALTFVPALIDCVQVRDGSRVDVHPVIVLLVPGASTTASGRRRRRRGARAAGREAVAAGGHVPIIAHAPHGGLDVALALGQSPALASTPV